MHDLLRAHARTLAATDLGSGEEARARLYHYYQHTARRAATLTTLTPRPDPGGPAPAYAPRCQAPTARGPGCAPPTCKRPSASCHSTSNSASLEADDRPSKTIQPQTRTKMRLEQA
jgi:hypothetical protein